MKVDPRFLNGDGPEVFTGTELLLKGALETAGGVHLLGGYPGSPIAGFFDSMSLVKDLLAAKGIRCVINNNEALASAMLNGSQVVGCRGMIVMKSVGVHVAADALALGNLAGAHPHGGAVVVYGDDPWSDSTQVAADSRFISQHLQIPVIEPANAQEVKDYVDLAFRVSAAAELYSGYVLTTNLADGGGSVTCRPNRFPRFNTEQKKRLRTAEIDLNKYVLLPPKTWWQEASLPDRHERAIAEARRLGLNRIDYPAERRKPVGFVTSGLAHSYLLQTLWELGLLGEMPILKFGMSYPADPQLIRELAAQCEQIVVVEERRAFLEDQVSEVILKDRQRGRDSVRVQVWGKQFPEGLAGIPATRGLHPSILISRLVPLLKAARPTGTLLPAPARADTLDAELATVDTTGRADVGELPTRLPTFCPGCPHRDSSAVCLALKKRFMDGDYMRRRHGRGPVDLVFHGDIGCYTMLMYPPNTDLMHNLSGMGLGGGTGAGVDPFVDNKQVVFMGDSTFFHSGQLAISQALKLGQDITFIILDNQTTAMTGHQPTPGVDFDVLGNATVRQDILEVVRGITAGSDSLVVRADPEKRPQYEALLEQAFLADGVKVIIADKECAITRLRRKRRAERAQRRRRGFLRRWEHMNVNPEVCRFCLACVEDTGCPGLTHVETDYGRKIDTDLTWCVNDGACERVGQCSAFERVTIVRTQPPKSRVPELGLDEIPEPHKRPVGELWRCCLTGVGGQGVGLATSILVRAAHKEGYKVSFVDKKGLAIRNGGVVSQLVYNISQEPITALIPYGKADLLVGIDVLEAARALDPQGRSRVASPERTAAVVNTHKVPTTLGLMGREDFDVARLEEIIRRQTRAEDYLARDISRICEKYLGSKLYANIMMLGFAFQKGLIPVSMHAMAWAIRDSIRSEVRKNLYAFNMGRKLCERADLFQGPPQRDGLPARQAGWKETLEDKCRWILRRYAAGAGRADAFRQAVAEAVAGMTELDEALRRSIVVRAYDCLRWGGLDYARRYLQRCRTTYDRDEAAHDYAATRAVVHNLASAMLIKDAVFVAELSTSPEKYARDRQKYNVHPARGDRIRYRHLWHVRGGSGARAWHKRLVLRPWQLRVLRASRWLRAALPRWHRTEKRYRAGYEAAVDAFAYDSADAYREQLALLGSAPCMNCANPRCREAGCPLANFVPQWTQLVYQGRWKEAYERLAATNNFPEITSRICPGFCEQECKQGMEGYAVQVRSIERRIIDRAFEEGWVHPAPAAEPSGKQVAVVGSGPAGLAAAQQLAREGHEVTVFEEDDKLGGWMRYGIPAWRLPKELIDRRLDQLRAEGVTFRPSTAVGADLPADRLREDFDAVLLATGARRPRDLDVPGRASGGVVQAMDFLRAESGVAAEPAPPTGAALKDKSVVVLGSGLTGEVCVLEAVRNGARSVQQLEILPETAVKAQLDGADVPAESVTRRWCVATKAFRGNGHELESLEAVRVEHVPSPAGRQIREVPGSRFTLDADLALLALGFEAQCPRELAEQLGLQRDDAGHIIADEFATSTPGVFVCGDLRNGATYVATAIDSGRRAADAIHRHLTAAQPVAEPAAAG